MTLFRNLFKSSPRWPMPSLNTTLKGPRVILRAGDPEDWREWHNIRSLSKAFLVPWEPSWPAYALTYAHFCGNLRRQWREWRQGSGYAFLVFLNNNDKTTPLIGGIALNDVIRGVTQKGTLGYWIGEPYANKGLMTEAAGLVTDFAFKTLLLHRVEASCIPRNEPSKRLLTKLNFTQEGFAKSYLLINGKWEDHILWGKTAEER